MWWTWIFPNELSWKVSEFGRWCVFHFCYHELICFWSIKYTLFLWPNLWHHHFSSLGNDSHWLNFKLHSISETWNIADIRWEEGVHPSGVRSSLNPSVLFQLLKETRNSFKKWPLNPWCISNKIGNVTKAAIFKIFLH